MRRWVFLGIGLMLIALAFVGVVSYGAWSAGPPIVVGILHSQTGPLAASEKPMIDAEIMALEEINAEGGLLHRPLTWVVADGRSSDSAFAQQAERLIAIDKVRVIFGCYASRSRKSVKPIIEENHHLLFYPAAYEGLEQSPNIIYTGGPANQQIFPAVSWCLDTLKARKFLMVGTDSIWPRVVGALVSDHLKARGAAEAVEEYLLPDTTDVSGVVEKIKQAAPDVVFCALEGDTTEAFFQRLAQAGIRPDRTPVVSFNVTEEELRTLPLREMVGHYSAWNYFESVDRTENQEFVRRFKARYGQDRPTNDGISTAYNSVKLWAQAVEESGTDEIPAILRGIRRQSLDAPEGVISVDSDSLQDWRPFYMGKIRSDGQFEIVFSLTKPIMPLPYPRTRTRAEWDAFIDNLSAEWGGLWANPAKVGAANGPKR
jgi:urea transport system substrate-binding protein